MTDYDDVFRALKRLTKIERPPYLFIGEVGIGGLNDLQISIDSGKFKRDLEELNVYYHIPTLPNVE